jgi:aryl-alcohol dehydrogenase-like predicted oxidoreductase
MTWSTLGGSTQAHEVGSHYGEFARVADELGASAQEVVLAWLLATSPVMIPIPGATRPATVDSIVRALSVQLTDDQRARLDATRPEMESMYPDDLPRSPLT